MATTIWMGLEQRIIRHAERVANAGVAESLVSDTVDIPDHQYAAIMSSADCTIKITTLDGDAVTIPVFKGYNPIGARRIWSTGSVFGASTVFGLW